MNKKVLISLAITALLILAGLFVFLNKSGENNLTNPDPLQIPCTQEAKICPDGTAVGRVGPYCEFSACPGEKNSTINPPIPLAESNNPLGTKDTQTQNSSAPTPSPGLYTTYSQEQLQNANKLGNKVVLFFHAKWCPFCIEADTAFTTQANDIPSGVTVLKIDYDTETELKKKYGVTYQHTFVQIDTQGNQVSKWNGGDVDNLIKYLR